MYSFVSYALLLAVMAPFSSCFLPSCLFHFAVLLDVEQIHWMWMHIYLLYYCLHCCKPPLYSRVASLWDKKEQIVDSVIPTKT